MLKITEKENASVFSVRVIPRASKTEIVGEHEGALKIRVASPPVEGAGNQELISFLSKQLGVAKSSFEILSGASSRQKILSVSGVSKAGILALLRL